MQRFRIFHETDYQYSSGVILGRHKILVRPRDGHDLRIEESRLAINPQALISWHRDELDNSVALATFDDKPTNQLTITSEVVVTHYLSSRSNLPLLNRAKTIPFSYTDAELSSLQAYLTHAEQGEAFSHWISDKASGITDTLQLLLALNEAIYTSFTYRERHEEGVHSPMDVLSYGTGTCRDYAWFLVLAVRKLGMAARFVSGYFHTAGTALADGSTHAWAEVYLPGAGWTGFDPTCNALTAENHVPVSVALYPEDIPPVSGLFTGPAGEVPSMTVRVNVNPC